MPDDEPEDMIERVRRLREKQPDHLKPNKKERERTKTRDWITEHELRRLALKDSHGGDENEWPEDLRGLRAFPVTP